MDKGVEKKIVSFGVFAWVIGIVFLLFGLVFTAVGQINGRIGEIDTKTGNNTRSISDVEGDIKAINENLLWLKASLIKNGWPE